MDAEAEAVFLGGHLVTINNAAEQTFLNAAFNTSPIPLWIGLNDAANEGAFVWSSAEPVTFTNWHPGEPNDGNGIEDFVAMNWHASVPEFPFIIGDWNDTPLNGTTGFGGNSTGPYRGVVELNIAAAAPEPGTLGLIAAVCAPLLMGALRRKK